MPKLLILVIELHFTLGSSMSATKKIFAMCEMFFSSSIDVLVSEGWAVGKKCKGSFANDTIISVGVEKVWIGSHFAIRAADIFAILRFRQRIHALFCYPVV